MWALDPIDGTKGFLRGGQYAVCLALLEDGEPVLGVMGTPNLPLDYKNSSSEKGVLFVTTKGAGAFQVSLLQIPTDDSKLRSILCYTQRSYASADLQPIHMAEISSLSEASFCESVEAGHSSKPLNARIAELMGITKPPVQMDSQAKYCSISRGDGNVYLRLPTSATYEEKIWVSPCC